MNQLVSLLVPMITIFLIPLNLNGSPGTGVPWEAVGVQALNFSIFSLILFFLLKNKVKLPSIFAKRKEDYIQLLHRAEQERNQAEKTKAEMAQRLTNLESEAQVTLKKVEDEAKSLREKILSEAQSTAEKYLNEAQKTAQHEFDKAVIGLRDGLLSGSLDGAKARLKEQMGDSSMQTKLSGEFTRKMQGMMQQ